MYFADKLHGVSAGVLGSSNWLSDHSSYQSIFHIDAKMHSQSILNVTIILQYFKYCLFIPTIISYNNSLAVHCCV